MLSGFSLYSLSSAKMLPCCFSVISSLPSWSFAPIYEIVPSPSSLFPAAGSPASTSACFAAAILRVWLWENSTAAFCRPVLISPHSNSSSTVIIILKSHRGHPLAQRDGSVYKKMHADVAAWQMMIVQFEGGKTVFKLLIYRKKKSAFCKMNK